MKVARIGIGFDAHRFAPKRYLVLGGVRVDYEYGLVGHSDADVMLHAIIDALLGACGQRDIGWHFPPDDVRWKDISSLSLLEMIKEFLVSKGFSVINVDVVLLAEEPKIAGYIDKMRNNISSALGIEESDVGVKASTTERMGFVGREEGLAAMAVANVIRHSGKKGLKE